ncbi:MAG: VWA domain-containing protein [Nannocystis sp.]|nr:VWA domain-containing protein [Nannocystis sp.]MBA3550248.1 VWA domain-containing protein [Nannocystis sp.]
MPPNKTTLAQLAPAAQSLVGRWRLVLGKDAEAAGVCMAAVGASGEDQQGAEQTLSFVYGDGRGAGSGGSNLTVPKWIEQVNELFPKQAREVLEREMIQKRGIAEILDQPDLLDRIEPNVELVKTLLTHKDLLTPKTRILARKVIDKVVQELRKKLEIRVEQAITGALRKDRHSPRRVFRNLDLRTTLRRNLRNWNQERRKLFVDRVFFYAAEKNKRPWHVIVCVDQSGSMLESAIFSAVMASIFAELPGVKTSLVLFDTQVVDLTDKVGAPVDVLLSVHLGGGTDITRALEYCSGLVREPARTILVLITDFYEGRPESDLVRVVERLAGADVRMIGLGALGYDAQPQYNRQTAKKLRKVGMDILSCTPEKLADCMGQIIRG